MEITVEEMRRLSPEDYILIDMRNEQTRDYGVIPGALPVSQEELAANGKEKLQENFNALMEAIVKAKPAASKGQYVRSCVIASTMGPGIRINPGKVGA